MPGPLALDQQEARQYNAATCAERDVPKRRASATGEEEDERK